MVMVCDKHSVVDLNKKQTIHTHFGMEYMDDIGKASQNLRILKIYVFLLIGFDNNKKNCA